MSTDGSGRGDYYRTIAAEFLKRRGAPLFLSARDLAVIASWEERRIPLVAVLEGLDRTFERLKKKARGTRGATLAFCEREVERALGQHQERSAGRRRAGPARPGKRERARREVERALRDIVPGDVELSRLFKSALDVLSEDRPDEEALEKIEEDIEQILYGRASPEEKARFLLEARRDLPGRGPEEIDTVSRAKVVKALRKKGRIPYVSPFYY